MMDSLSVNDYSNRTVSLEDLTSALVVAHDGKMLKDEAKKVALTVLSFFGFSEVVLDNLIEDARDMFYIIEKTTLYSGK